MEIVNLKTLHQVNPVIDKTPYFSWNMISDRKNTMQKSYRITVSSGQKVVWDSGEVESCAQSFVPYEGEQLTSCMNYRWNVTVCDNDGRRSCAEAFFETAFLDQDLWHASWVESTIPRVDVEEYAYGNQPPAVLFTRAFTLEKQVKKARLYATALGVYRLYVNDHPDRLPFA